MVSTRYAPAVLVLLTLAAVPTAIHSYMDSSKSDGRTAQAIPTRLAGQTAAPTTRRADWGHERFNSTDWFERRFSGPPAVTLFVARSLDAKRLYHHPELAVDYGHSYDPEKVVRLSERPDIPVHLLQSAQSKERRVALYVLHHGQDYVADPIRFQLRTALVSMFRPRQPMTLFFAVQDIGVPDAPESSAAASVLLSAIAAFEQQKP